MVLTPMVADAVRIPVIAGGGIADAGGSGSPALGADAVYMGTRFMASVESESHANVKEAVVRAQDVCTVSVPKEYMLARDLENSFTRTYLDMHRSGAPAETLRAYLAQHAQYPAQHLGDADSAEICCGQAAGLLSSAPPASEIVASLIRAIPAVFEEVREKLLAFSEEVSR
jgi:NAD(P)H-dependent flavin oxidoreductase YrpB (nitropropane dioxygenase family)